jgi:hypothetical protein
MTLLTPQVMSKDRILIIKWKGCWSGRNVVNGTILEFAWRDWDKLQKAQPAAEFEALTIRIQMVSPNWSAVLFDHALVKSVHISTPTF